MFANIYLNQLDQYVKHTLKIKLYYRYVDDFLIFSNSKKDLKVFRRKIKLFLSKELLLDVPKNKIYINLVSKGVDFLGYKVFPSNIRLKKSNVKRFLKRQNKNNYLLKQNKISILNFRASLFSFLDYAKHSNSYNLLSTLNIK